MARQELNRALSGWWAAGHGSSSLQTAPQLPLGQSPRKQGGSGGRLASEVRHAPFYVKTMQACRKAVDQNFSFPPHTAINLK